MKIYFPSFFTNYLFLNQLLSIFYHCVFINTGERNYGPAVDLWGAGCIMAEMWTRSPIMQGNTEQHQLTLIAQVLSANFYEIAYSILLQKVPLKN